MHGFGFGQGVKSPSVDVVGDVADEAIGVHAERVADDFWVQGPSR